MKLFLQPMRSKPLNIYSPESFSRPPHLVALWLLETPLPKERSGDARHALNRHEKNRQVVVGESASSLWSQATD